MTGFPKKLPSWATNANFADPGKAWDGQPCKVIPPSGTQTEGVRPAYEMPAEYFNYLMNLQSENANFGRSRSLLNWRRSSLTNGAVAATDFRSAVWAPKCGYEGVGAWAFASNTTDEILLEETPGGLLTTLGTGGGSSLITSIKDIAASDPTGAYIVAVGSGAAQTLRWTSAGVGGSNLSATVVSISSAAERILYVPSASRFVAFATALMAYSNSAVNTWTDVSSIPSAFLASGVRVASIGFLGSTEVIALTPSVGGGSAGWWVSTDAGVTYPFLASSSTAFNVNGLGWNEVDSEWLSLDNTGVCRSSTDLVNWTARGTIPDFFIPKTKDALKVCGNLLLAVSDNGVAVSSDAGATWSRIGTRDSGVVNDRIFLGAGRFVRTVQGPSARSVYYSERLF